MNLYLNDTDVRYLAQDNTPLQDGDALTIVPSIAGGSGALATEPAALSHPEILRYSRHLLLPEVGVEGQRRLKQARVLLVGAGGLGSPASLYLAAAGVGTIGLVEFDVVDATNLQRQIVHGTSTVGQPKLTSAEARLKDLNPFVRVEGFDTRLTSDNALEILREFDVIVDGTDNFPTRYLVNDACVLLGKPNVYGSIFRFEGQASVFSAAEGPCYRCLYSEPPPPGLVPSCAEGGVLGVLPGIIGSIQALETIKLILGAGDSLIGRLVLFDALRLRFRELDTAEGSRSARSAASGPRIHELIDYEAFCGIGDESAPSGPEITARELKGELEQGKDAGPGRRAGAPRVGDCSPRRCPAYSPGPAAQPARRAGRARGHRDHLPPRSALPQGARDSEGRRIRPRPQFEGRYRRLGRGKRSGDGEILTRSEAESGNAQRGTRRMAQSPVERSPSGVTAMPKGGLEPPRACAHCALNAARLPVPPLRLAGGQTYFPRANPVKPGVDHPQPGFYLGLTRPL